ncbi:MAG: phosphate acyltransferase PlsX [Planctomycetes bacterium]|nr:phosphate acyltransferase PlsX [Planctomycetota bacterium]
MTRIAIDAMGGDFAPGVVVRGAYRVAQEHKDWVMILVGDETAVRKELDACGAALPNIAVVHAPETIGMDEHPVEALKAKRNAGLPMCVGMVHQGKADAVISAGNTGALVAGATLMLRNLPGVRRAGICTSLPSIKGRVAIMDVGANVQAKPQHLVQYGIMGEIFYRNVLAAPEQAVKVGLLSVGGEEGKGNAVVRETHTLLTQSPVDFIGNVEGHEIFEGRVEVVVCDGLVGNVVLKTAEGLSDILMKMFVNNAGRAELSKDPRFDAAWKSFNEEIDWREVGGAALLGVNGVVVISHGRSDERAISSGIRIAAGCAKARINDKIVAALSKEEAKAGAGPQA